MDLNTRMRLQEWASDYAEWQNSRMTQKDWCSIKGLSVNTFAYRCRCVRRHAEAAASNVPEISRSQVDFVAITPPADLTDRIENQPTGAAPLRIHLRNAMIEVSNDACAKNLRIVLKAQVTRGCIVSTA